MPAAPTQAEDLVVVLEAAPKTLNPVLATDATGVRIAHQLLFETLITLDDTAAPAPGVAEGWERHSGNRLTLRLAEGHRFADGSALDSADVLHTLRSLMDPATASPYGGVLRQKIASLRAPDARTVELTLSGPYASILTDLILPVRPADPGAPELLGSGPYVLESQGVNDMLLVRNAAYAGPPAASERLRFTVVQDETTRFLKFRKGDVHLGVNVLPLDKLAQFEDAPLAADYQVLEAPGLSYQYLGFNLRDPVLGQSQVRQAIAHAIDVDGLIRFRQFGHATRAAGLFPQSSPWAAPGVTPPAYDPAEAKRLLDAAGFPERGGKRFDLTYKTSTDRSATLQARIIAQQLKQVGIAVTVRSYEWGVFYDDIQKGNFQLFSLRWIGVSEPDFLHTLFHSSQLPPAGRNRGGLQNAALDPLLEALRLEPDEAARRSLVHQAQQHLAEALPYVSLWHNNTIAIVSRRVTGFRLHPTGGFQHLPAARLAQP